MSMVPNEELIRWIDLIKNVALSLAAFFTVGLGIYGVKQWKYEYRGTEAFGLVENLIVESHKLTLACATLRRPIQAIERKQFTLEERKYITESERWKLSEHEAFERRFEDFQKVHESYREALLNARSLLGSHIYVAFLDFGQNIGNNVQTVNRYLEEVLSDSFVYRDPKQPELLSLQERHLMRLDISSDELQERTADSREAGEMAVAKYLGRRSIRG